MAELSPTDREIIGFCLHAAATGPFFENIEFHTIFGLQRAELMTVANDWPEVDMNAETVRVAVNNTLNNLTGYPHGLHNKMRQYVAVDIGEINHLHRRWHRFLKRMPKQ